MNTGQATGIVILTLAAIAASQPGENLYIAMIFLVAGTIAIALSSTHWYRSIDYEDWERVLDERERRRSLAQKSSEINRDTLCGGTSEEIGGGTERSTDGESEAPWEDQRTGGRLEGRERLVDLYPISDPRAYPEVDYEKMVANADWVDELAVAPFEEEPVKIDETDREEQCPHCCRYTTVWEFPQHLIKVNTKKCEHCDELFIYLYEPGVTEITMTLGQYHLWREEFPIEPAAN